MKACANHRKELALLAIGALVGQEANVLREHLEGCAGCRDYLAQMEQVTERLRAAEPTPEMRPSLYLHRRVREQLRERPPARIMQWRLAASAAVVAAVLMLTMHRGQKPTKESPAISVTVRPKVNDFDVTVLNYQLLADESPDKLDKALTEQGTRSLPPTPIYRAGGFASGNALDQPGI